MKIYFPAAYVVVVQPQPGCVALSTSSQTFAARAIRAAATGRYFTTAAKTQPQLDNAASQPPQSRLVIATPRRLKP